MSNHSSKKATAPVVCLDSGIGGLHIFKALSTQISAPLFYIADYAGFPYGDQSHEALRSRLIHLVATIQTTIHPSLIVLACNTATTIAIEALRLAFPGIAFVGCVPAIKPAATESKTGYIALLATSATCQQPAIDSLIKHYASHCQVVRFPLPSLAPLAESYFSNSSRVNLAQTRDALRPLLEHPYASNIDHIILGCTHYRFLLPLLQEAGHKHWRWIDSTEAVALQAYRIWAHHYQAEEGMPPATAGSPDSASLHFLYTEEAGRLPLPATSPAIHHLPAGLHQLGLTGLTPQRWYWLTPPELLKTLMRPASGSYHPLLPASPAALSAAS